MFFFFLVRGVNSKLGECKCGFAQFLSIYDHKELSFEVLSRIEMTLPQVIWRTHCT